MQCMCVCACEPVPFACSLSLIQLDNLRDAVRGCCSGDKETGDHHKGRIIPGPLILSLFMIGSVAVPVCKERHWGVATCTKSA